jgi:ribosomal-protein-alanine N-acetyltransferase
MDSGLVIRQADIEDADAMFSLEQDCFNVEAFSIHQLRYLINTDTSLSYVAECEGGFAGFIIGLTNRNRSGKYGRIYTLDVGSGFRRMGVATALVLSLMEGFKKCGCSRCFLEVRLDNERALSLYEKMGFERKYVILDYYSPGVHAIKMKKPL